MNEDDIRRRHEKNIDRVHYAKLETPVSKREILNLMLEILAKTTLPSFDRA